MRKFFSILSAVSWQNPSGINIENNFVLDFAYLICNQTADIDTYLSKIEKIFLISQKEIILFLLRNYFVAEEANIPTKIPNSKIEK